MKAWDNHKFQVTAVYWHAAESVILVLKQGPRGVLGIILLINSAQTEIVLVKESSNVPWKFAIGSFVHTALTLNNGMAQ